MARLVEIGDDFALEVDSGIGGRTQLLYLTGQVANCGPHPDEFSVKARQVRLRDRPRGLGHTAARIECRTLLLIHKLFDLLPKRHRYPFA